MHSIASYPLRDHISTDTLERSCRLAIASLDIAGASVYLRGADDSWRRVFAAGDTPEVSSEAVAQMTADAPFWVEDLRDHQLAADHPWVDEDARVGFCACMPLTGTDEAVDGCLVLTDADPRSLDASQVQLLRDLVALTTDASEPIETSAPEQHAARDDRLSLLLDLIPHIIVVKDADGKMLLCNERFAHQHGLEPDEVVGMHLSDFVSPADAATQILESDREILDNGEPQRLTQRLHLAGSERIVETFKARWKNWDDGVDAVVSVVTDLTELQEAHSAITEHKRRLETIVNLVPQFVVVKDYDGHMLLSNRAHAATYNSTPEEMVGRHFFEFVEPIEVAEAVLESDRRVIDTGETLRTKRTVVIDGEEVPVDVIKIKYENWEPGQDAVLGVVSDLRPLEQREEELERLVDELQRSNRQLEQFAYVASHDLQEPLRMVTGFLGLLEEEYSGQLDDEADEYIEFAVDGARRMQSMINDLLAYSRVRTSNEELDEVDLAALAHDVCGEVLSNHREADAEITIDELPTTTVRPRQMRRLFTNLFVNAIKHAQSYRPRVHVSVEDLGDYYQFAVSDEGPGIPQDQHERIFQIFVRGSRRDEQTGTGIGLAICSTIVEEHGGRIWVESTPGQGAQFHFTLAKEPTL